jgi:hypothetical protein
MSLKGIGREDVSWTEQVMAVSFKRYVDKNEVDAGAIGCEQALVKNSARFLWSLAPRSTE